MPKWLKALLCKVRDGLSHFNRCIPYVVKLPRVFLFPSNLQLPQRAFSHIRDVLDLSTELSHWYSSELITVKRIFIENLLY